MEKLKPYYGEQLSAEEIAKRDDFGNQWISYDIQGKITLAFLDYCKDKDVVKLIDTIREYFDFDDLKLHEHITDFDRATIERFIHLECCVASTAGMLTNKKHIESCKLWENSATWTAVRGIVEQVAE